MHIIVCLDDRNGMQFNHRRQSTDRILLQHLLAQTENVMLWMQEASAAQFPQLPASVKVAPSCLWQAAEGDYCFVEDSSWEPFSAQIRKIIVYRWNRAYPADLWFPASELSKRKLVSVSEFSGFSHERITQEIYDL